ncbi:serine/threonine-protein kinase [Stenomitos frigidus]|uniref:non-specific serine/threonine protein kinase n=1 Tax=Stenomitos frigidus ULC18 TaxID=2107698 RepID=A0A2T1EBH0_9CYAN|nr:serine/threonine-protein kinase [Stenomitos frigidus]PSB30043.1 serine/threonine protein kinase [Stenomitos frigidus ULC18]
MRPPIPIGTTLQNRYRILSVLGQGGFGRTYLSEDQGRFNELCALKELIPAQGNAYALDKSKELFQREAQILYQIQHPQIPQFRATFEEDQRLFLVQDYVEGQTYRTLLEQRQVQGIAFSEAEVLQLMRQLLPVLAHIHSKGIIHRDIAPDNIMLRQQDGKPVLIDFGVVKELATRFQSPTLTVQNTTVGKPGFAPSEQMQSGRAYPSSDLYSLAVTAVVLLTGREPQTLLDDTTLTWYWQRWVTVSPGFTQVLNKMLSYRPDDRFQSVAEVVQALQSPTAYTPPPYQPPAQTAAPPNPDVSHMATMAVGRRPDPLPAAASPNRDVPIVPPPRSSVWDDPLAVVAIGLGLVVLTGVGTWAVVRAVLNNQPTPSPTPSLTASVSPSPTFSFTPTPKPTNEPIAYSQNLDINPDTKATKTGTLRSNETVTYILAGEQGQQLNAVISGEGVLMTMLGPDRQPLSGQSNRVSLWQGTLPYTGNYYIQLSPVKGLAKSDYRLDVVLRSAATPSPTPTQATPSPSPSPSAPSIQTHRVRFEAGQTATTVSDRANPQVIHRYLVRATEGQIFKAVVRDGSVTLNITTPDGQAIQAASNVLSWEDQLPMSGTYQIDVIAAQDTNFSLDISIRN